jgi:dTMP kinase
MLAGELRARGLDVLTTCEPGGTPLGRHLREAFLETEETVAPLAELLLFAADRAQHVEFLIKPALGEGRVVISDRYADATVAYQGAGRGFDRETLDNVVSLATGGLKPGLTLFFDTSIETALQRTISRGEGGGRPNRMDFETVEFYERVRNAYLSIARTEPERFKIIDANDSIGEIQERVLETTNNFLGI